MTPGEHRMTVLVWHDYARWAWLAVALTPILFVAGVVLSFAASGAGPGLGGALVGLLVLTAPTAALLFAAAGVRAGQRAAHKVQAPAVVVYLVSAILLPVAVISVTSWMLALTASVAVLGLGAWRHAG